MIAGGEVKCRFKYRDVPANDFGLSAAEVLSCPDRELNAWSSLKKTCQFRSEEDERHDINLYKSKGGNVVLKKKVLPSLFAQDPEDELEAEKAKKREKSRKRKKKMGDLEDVEEEEEENPQPSTSKRKRKKKNKNDEQKKKSHDLNAGLKMGDDRLEAYAIKPNQLKRKVRKEKFKANNK